MNLLEAPTLEYFKKDAEKLVEPYCLILRLYLPQRHQDCCSFIRFGFGGNQSSSTQESKFVFKQAFTKNTYYEEVKTLKKF